MEPVLRVYRRRNRGTRHGHFDFVDEEEVGGHDDAGDDVSTPPLRSRQHKPGTRPALKSGRKRRSSSFSPEPQRKRSRAKKPRTLSRIMPEPHRTEMCLFFAEVDKEVLEETSESDVSDTELMDTGDDGSQDPAETWRLASLGQARSRATPSPQQNDRPPQPGDEERTPGPVPSRSSSGHDLQRTSSGPSRRSTDSGGQRPTAVQQSTGRSKVPAASPSPVLPRRSSYPMVNPSLGMPADWMSEGWTFEEPCFSQPQSATTPTELASLRKQNGSGPFGDLYHWERHGFPPRNPGSEGTASGTPASGSKEQGSGSGRKGGKEEKEDDSGASRQVGDEDDWDWGGGAGRNRQGQTGMRQRGESMSGWHGAQSPVDRRAAMAARLRRGYSCVADIQGRRPLEILEPVAEVSEGGQTATQTQPTGAEAKEGRPGATRGTPSPTSSVEGPQRALTGKKVDRAGPSRLSVHSSPRLQPPAAPSNSMSSATRLDEAAGQKGASGSAGAAREADSRLLESSDAQRDGSGVAAECIERPAAVPAETCGPSQNGAAAPAVKRKSSVGVPAGERKSIPGAGARASAERTQDGPRLSLDYMADLPAAADDAPGARDEVPDGRDGGSHDTSEDESGESSRGAASEDDGSASEEESSRDVEGEEEGRPVKRAPVGRRRTLPGPGDASASPLPSRRFRARSMGQGTEPEAVGAEGDSPPASIPEAGRPPKASIGCHAGRRIPSQQELQAQGAGSPQLANNDPCFKVPRPPHAQAEGLEQGAAPAARGATAELCVAQTPAAVRQSAKSSVGLPAPKLDQSEQESPAPGTGPGGRGPSLLGSFVGRSAQVLHSFSRHFARSSVGPGAIFPGTPLARSDYGQGVRNESRRSLAAPRYGASNDADIQDGPSRQMWRRQSVSGSRLWQMEQEQAQIRLQAQAQDEEEGQCPDATGPGASGANSGASASTSEHASDGVPARGASGGDRADARDLEKENQRLPRPTAAKPGQRQSRRASIGIPLRDAGARVQQGGPEAEAHNAASQGAVTQTCKESKDAGAPLPRSSPCSQREEDAEMAALQRMLEMGGQDRPCSLKSALSQFCNVEDILKMGEGSYAEVFGVLSEAPLPGTRSAPANSVCFKIVPMGGPAVEGAEQKPISELETEVAIHVAINKLREERSRGGQEGPAARTMGFIQLKGVRVCMGAYPKVLLDSWTAYDEQFVSENLNPKCYSRGQLYCVFALEMGGTNLEEYRIRSFDEMKAIMFQTTAALAAAEEGCQFEHRDLHWGNVMISQTAQPSDRVTLDGQTHEFSTGGLKVSLIDFTLSRVHTGERVIFCDLSRDNEIFEGPKGDIQSDTYRAMKKLTRRKWNAWHPKTNVLWLSYLLETVSTRKMLKLSPKEDRLVAAFKKRVGRAGVLRGLVHDEFFEGIAAQEPGA